MNYLQTVKDHVFPILVSDVHGLECAKVMDAAGLIEATFEPGSRDGTDAAAVVRRITGAGWSALNRCVQGKPLA